MIKNSKLIKWFALIASMLIGGYYGWISFDAPISKTLLKFRILAIILAVILSILAVVGMKLIKKYNVNDELVIDDEMEDYFLDMMIKFKANMIIGIGIGFLLLMTTFIAEYHAPVMMPVTMLYYFVIMLIFIFPIFDEAITIIKMIVDYNRIQLGSKV